MWTANVTPAATAATIARQMPQTQRLHKKQPHADHNRDKSAYLLGQGALAEHGAGENHDIHRRAVLKEDRVRAGGVFVRVDKEQHGEGIRHRRDDLVPAEVQLWSTHHGENEERCDETPCTGDRHRGPIHKLDEKAAQAPADRGRRHGHNAFDIVPHGILQ